MENKIIDHFTNNMQIIIEKEQINLGSSTFVLGVSTGVDSMALLDLFLKLREKYHLKIVVCHVNHKKRLQSEEEEAFIKKYCNDNRIALELLHLTHDDITDNFQSDARSVRYKFYVDTCIKYQTKYFVLAHHALDNMETILMRISRGSSLKGYSGMSMITPFKEQCVLRPLINILKDDLYQYCNSNNVKFYEDASNKEDDYTRNRYRKYIIPEILKENPQSYLKFLEFSEVLNEANAIITKDRDNFINNKIIKKTDRFIFNNKDFLELDNYMQIEVLFEIFKPLGLSKANIYETIDCIKSDKSNIISLIKNKWSICKEYDLITILKYPYQKKEVYLVIDDIKEYPINDILKINVIKNNMKLCANVNELWYNSSMLPFTLRSRREGDRILLKDGYKKVKDILIDSHIGILARNDVMVLEDNQHEIIWVVGIKKSYATKRFHDNYDITIKIGE